MRRAANVSCALSLLCTLLPSLIADDRPKPAGAEYVHRTYPVEDLVTPIPSATFPSNVGHAPRRLRYQPLIEHLRRTTGADAWRTESSSMQFYEHTSTLVIKQTPELHRRIVDEMS